MSVFSIFLCLFFPNTVKDALKVQHLILCMVLFAIKLAKV